MNIGMLWYDNDPKDDLDGKVKRAATFYQDKYGKSPTLCFVHPSMLPQVDLSTPEKELSEDASQENEKVLVTAGVEVRSNFAIMPNHFWVGVNGNSNNGSLNS